MAENVILRDDELANLDPQKLEQAKKRFQQTTYEVTRDVAPITGEYQSYKYAMQDAADIAKAAKGEEGYEDMTPIEALGKVGMVGLGVLGMIPVVGYGPRLIRKGISSLMPQRTPRSNIPENIDQTRPVREDVREALINDPNYRYFVDNLPEYRRTYDNDTNMREFVYMPNEQRQALINQRTEQLGLGERIVSGTRTNLNAERQRAISDSKTALKYSDAEFDAKNVANSGKMVGKVIEPYSFGKGAASKETGTVKDFIGSEAFDYVNRFGNEEATAQQWLGFLKGSRQKGVKSEELSDSGLVMFKGDEAVAGDIYNIAKTDPNRKIKKSEILAVLETNPAFNLKTTDYGYPISQAEVLNVLPNFTQFSEEGLRIINSKILATEDVANRSTLNTTQDLIGNDMKNFSGLASRLSNKKEVTQGFIQTKNRLQELLPTLNDNDKLIIRNLIDEYDNVIKLSTKAQEATKVPRHSSSFPGGGMDYREKVIYYDRPIPGNSNPIKKFTVHFNEPNPIAHVRYDTRGVDNFGDTIFIGEIQSDPHQTLSKGAASLNTRFKKGESSFGLKDMKRRNPFSDKITASTTKRKIAEIRDQIKVITNKASKEALFKSEFDELDRLRKALKAEEAKIQRRPAQSMETVPEEMYSERMFDTSKKQYDYFPMGNEQTWIKMSLKTMVNDARKKGKKYIAIAPADFYHLGINNKQKIEQFYGLGGRELKGRYQDVGGQTFTNKDGTGVGKYRDYETGKLKGTADVPKAMQAVAKEIGGKVEVKRIYHTDPNKPYKLIRTDTDSDVPAYAFKTKNERQVFIDNARSGRFEIVDITDVNDPRNYVESVVLNLRNASKNKMKGYKRGGLVEVKREFFAPLF